MEQILGATCSTMAIDLMNLLSSFDVSDDLENDNASFRTRIPWVGSEAYLHIVYKPAALDILALFARKLNLPEPLIQFLRHQNGADLFSGALYIYGVVPPGQLLNRTDPFSLPPPCIERANSESLHIDSDRFLVVGGYGFNGAQACFDRRDAGIKLLARNSATPTTSWRNLENWISSEITRLTLMFDRSGRRLVDDSATVPPRESRAQ